jgi:lysophospholipase L1-like esterase
MLSRLLAGSVLSLLLCVQTGWADGTLLVKDGQKVAFMGDSITQQGWEVPGGYVKLVTAGLETLGVKIVPIPAGVSGNTSADMLGRLDRDVLSKKPDWVTLSCGVNDVWHGANGVALEPYKTNITSIVDQCQKAGIKVLILTATVIGEDDNDNNKKLAAYNDFLRQLAKERNLPLAEENGAFQDALKATPKRGDRPGVLTNDGVHPNPEGHQLMAKTIIAGFGATPDQITKVEQAWFDMPGGANIDWRLEFTEGPITIHQWEALKSESTRRGTPLSNLTDTLFFEALKEAIKAHENDQPPVTRQQIGEDVQKRFSAKIDALTKP